MWVTCHIDLGRTLSKIGKFIVQRGKTLGQEQSYKNQLTMFFSAQGSQANCNILFYLQEHNDEVENEIE